MGPAASFAITRLERSGRQSFVRTAPCLSPAPTRAREAARDTQPIYDSVARGWTVGPDFPNGDNAGDSFAVLLTNGNVLVEGDSEKAISWMELTLTPQRSTFPEALMVLPNGQVLVGGGTTEVYTSSGTYQSSWQPTISSYPIYCISWIDLLRSPALSLTDCRRPIPSETSSRRRRTILWYKSPIAAPHHVFYARTHGHSTHGRGHWLGDRFHQLRRAGHDRNRREHISGHREWHSIRAS